MSIKATTLAVAAAAAVLGIPLGSANATTTASATVTWQADLTQAGAQQVNIATTNGISIADARLHPAAAGRNVGYASDLLPATTTSGPVDRITAAVSGQVPSGTQVVVDVRGQRPDAGWTEWQTANGTTGTSLGTNVTTVQERITLWGNNSGQTPEIGAVTLTGTAAPAAPVRAQAQAQVATTATTANPLSFRVYATDEGLVGGTTANGHVIHSEDHFVALPSGTALSPNGSDQYEVQVCGPAACETAPVWDIGPWNVKDNYWDPSSQRQEYSNLQQGMPEAQAAYQNGYNGGASDSDSHVSNPAGIDLADGTFHDVMGSGGDNGDVTVTYLWTDGGDGTATTYAASSPVVQFGQQVQVFGRTSAGVTNADAYTPGSGWSGWSSLGGTLADDPTAVPYGKQMEVFGRAANDHTYSDVWTSGSGWSGWQDLGGTIVSDPVAIQYGSQMQVYGRAANGHSYSDVYTPGKGWSGWNDLGGVLAGNLSVVEYGSQIQVYGRTSGGTTYSDVYTPGSGWSGWNSLGGNITTDPVAIQYGSQMQVYGATSTGATYSDVYSPGKGWSGWQSIGGTIAGSPIPVVYGSQMQVFGRTSGGTTYSDVYTPGSGWSGWNSLGGDIATDPVAIQYGSQMQVYGTAASGHAYSDVYTQGKGWSGWQDLGGDLAP
jgi:hypothetical protein